MMSLPVTIPDRSCQWTEISDAVASWEMRRRIAARRFIRVHKRLAAASECGRGARGGVENLLQRSSPGLARFGNASGAEDEGIDHGARCECVYAFVDKIDDLFIDRPRPRRRADPGRVLKC
jgi:hypothetical protein